MTEAMFDSMVYLLNNYGLLYILAGTVYGMIVGAIPGLGGVFSLSLLLPLTFGMEPPLGMALLVAAYAGTVYGGCITSILLNMPGTTGSISTCFDGFPLTRMGHAGRALGAATISSWFGATIGAISLLLIGPWLGRAAAYFSSPLFFMIIVFAFVMIAVASRASLLKGLIMGFLGIGISFIGLDTMTFTVRYTFDSPYIYDGIPFPPAMIGLYAFAQAMIFVAEKGKVLKVDTVVGNVGEGIVSFLRAPVTVIRSSILGIFIGLLPGVGINMSNLLNYMIEKNTTSDKDSYGNSFGEGNIRGVISPETANNATSFGSLSTAFALGIPGGATDAMLLAALMMFGLDPGRRFFDLSRSIEFPVVIWGMLIGALIFLILGLSLGKYFAKVAEVNYAYLIPFITVLAITGAFAFRGYVFDVGVMLVFALIGYIATKYKFPRVNLVVGMVLGAMAERNFIRSLIFSEGSYSIFVQDIPAFLVFLVSMIFLVFSYGKPFFMKHYNRFKGKN